MRILIVEDDERIADFLSRALRSEGFHCVTARDGRDALQLAMDADFDLILLDVMIPSLSGLEVCQELRVRKNHTPIIMLTAMDSVDDMVAGLTMGADDYITKPFAIENLLARVHAVLRRGKPADEEDTKLRYRNVEFDSLSMKVMVGGERVDFSAKELAILELFISNPEKLFSRERILSNVWGMDRDPLTNVVDVYIGKLRKKLSARESDARIETVRGLGYRLIGNS